MKNEMLPSEALYLFIGELTTRKEQITLSERHDASKIAELVDEFCNKHDLKPPRDNWHKMFPRRKGGSVKYEIS